MGIHIIWFGYFSFWIYLGKLEHRCFAIWIILSILSTNIIVFSILPIVSLLDITKSISLNPVIDIRLTIYIRFNWLSSYLYIYNGRKSFNKTQIYFRVFSVTVADNRHMKIVENISFKNLNIWYFFWKFC